ncbi:hydantoinase B/oxoprolinase family protein [Amycolatopsis jejuensis]|uniref:hydantoinase B/oxoprolinase family protein n=1 Tax=Amycolatopsis jejuensis TaxID=330084 RepID=UPI0005255231|nr:hydantoinase B/oxoprolinase family protein [Amycolatopsis jejuensis]
MTGAIELEVLRTRLLACTGEVAAALANAAPTVELAQGREFAVAVADPQGNVAAIDNPARLGSVEATVRHVSGYFEFDLIEGDVVITNDPYHGGTRVQEPTLVAPLILDSELVLHLVAQVRIGDMGGQVGGNLNPAATELLAEGVPVTPMKIRRLGRPVRDIQTAFLLNGRRPEETRRIIEVAIAALSVGHRRIGELISQNGVAAVKAALGYAQDYTERSARRALSSWEAGTYTGERTLDLGEAGPLTVRAQATVDGGELTIDLSASDDQQPLFVNSPAGVTASAVTTAVHTVLGSAVPANSGLTRVFRLVTRPGSIVDPQAPAPCGYGASHCGSEIVGAVGAALGQAVAKALPALSVPRPLVVARPAADTSALLDFGRWGIGGASAAGGTDGWGRPAPETRSELPSAEQWETDTGLPVESVEYLADSGGAGTWTGAPGVETVLAVAPDLHYTLWTTPSAGTVAGTDGGSAGAAGEIAFEHGGTWTPAPETLSDQPIPADRIRLRVAGGGGYGDPRSRDAAAIAGDIEDGLLSPSAAASSYGKQGTP